MCQEEVLQLPRALEGSFQDHQVCEETEMKEVVNNILPVARGILLSVYVSAFK